MDFDTVVRRFEEARAARVNWDTMWQDIADRVMPQMADFTYRNRSQGQRRTEKMLDATPALASERALAAIVSFFWPSNQRYQRLDSAVDDEDQVQQAEKLYLDRLTRALFRARYSPRASFDSQFAEAGRSFVVFGTGSVFVDDSWNHPELRKFARTNLYKALPLASTYMQENAAARIDTLHRCWNWTLRQLAQRFPDTIPQKLKDLAIRSPDQTIEVCHTVLPREDYDPRQIGPQGMPWASIYYIPGEKTKLEEGGFQCWPFAIMRYMAAPGEVYGRSPAWLAMSNIRVLNTQKRTSLAAAQKVADPPLLAADIGELALFNQAPGATNYGALDSSGNELVKPLITNANVQLTLEMMDKERDIISSAFFLDVFRALVDNPQMTATQALELMQERATLMAPIGGRIESEGLGPLTEREVSLMALSGQLPPGMPPDLVARGAEYKITYTSPMRQAMRASEGIAITRTMEAIIPMANIDQSVLDAFDLTAAARKLGEVYGVPPDILRSPEDIAKLGQQRQLQQNAAAAVQAAPQVSAAAANMAKMQANAGAPAL